uniref:Uncharacterized protein n=1 Tax=Moniliophthora roreri TaxID=221103 RepID=A0A0W0F1R8_MONRR
MSSSFSPTQGELTLAGQIFAQTDSQKLGILKGDEAVRIFGGAKLAPTVLGEIWNIADADNNGWLSRKGIAIALRLMGWAQKGEKISKDLVNKPGPLPVIEGLAPTAQHTGLAPQLTGMSIPKSPPPGLPPISQADKTKFHNMFMKAGPVNGLLSADQARDLFLKSKLPNDTLLQIWNLADTQDRGALDVVDFALGMYFIQGTMSGTISTLPDSLPQRLYQQAAAGLTTSGSFSPGPTQSTFPQTRAPIQPQYTGQTPVMQPQYTGQTSVLQPQNTGMSTQKRPAPTLPARPNPSQIGSGAFGVQASQWDVTAAEKTNADRYFDTLDTAKAGYIEGDVAVPFMLESKLPDDVLAHIWDLSDLSNNGRLSRDGFAVAMHLIQKKLAGGDLPETLPPSLIPPSMRTNGATPFASGTHRPAPPPPMSQQPAPEPTQDLFSFDDTPPASATSPPPSGPFSIAMQSTGPQPRSVSSPPPPPASRDPFGSGRDLLSDDDEPVSSRELHDRSAEIGNIQNQLNSTNRSMETAKSERVNLEQTLADQASQLSSLQTQLSLAKAAYETETKSLAHLKDRHANQMAEIQKTRQELITAESDLSALRVEKAEIEGAFLRDKEEARELHKKMIETSQQTETLKAETEKAKKDAKQQKGLLAIAKKQLASKEAERAKAEKELEEASAEVTSINKGREEAETELERLAAYSGIAPASPTADTSVISSPGRTISPDSLMFAASQPLPATPDLNSPAVGVASPSKSNNPFERLAMTGSPSPRSQSPFLPFTNAAVPTPPVADVNAADAAEKTAEPSKDHEDDDPFGFSKEANGLASASEPTPTTTSTASDTGTPKAEPIAIPKAVASAMPGAFGSPTESELFTTPPSTAVPQFEASPQRQTTIDAAASKFPEIDGTVSPGDKKVPEVSGETDLGSSLRELEVDESDSDSSDDEDEVPLAELAKTKTAEAQSQPEKKETTSFDDIFGVSSDEPATAADKPKNELPTDAFGMPVSKNVGQEALSESQPTSISHVASPTEAGVSAFDEAMGNMSSTAPSTAPSSSAQPQFSFDSAFDDNFDFGAAGGTSFPPAPKTNGHAPATNGDDGFDSLFSSQPPTSVVTNSAADSTPKPQAPTLPNNTSTNPSAGPSFDDVFSGFGSAPSLNLDAPASPKAATQEAATADSPARKPFPSASIDSPTTSPRPSVTRTTTPPPRAKSPPPRVGSPKPPRPSTASGSSRDGQEKEKKEPPPRHSKLSIRLPFGKKKKQQHEPPPPPPSQMLTPPQEEPDRQAGRKPSRRLRDMDMMFPGH